MSFPSELQFFFSIKLDIHGFYCLTFQQYTKVIRAIVMLAAYKNNFFANAVQQRLRPDCVERTPSRLGSAPAGAGRLKQSAIADKTRDGAI
jgi:hypothetical protein